MLVLLTRVSVTNFKVQDVTTEKTDHMAGSEQARDGTFARGKPAYHHGDLGTALVDVVRDLIERDGVGDFSIAEACKRLGVSTAAPYKHFSDKHDILRHVAKSGFDELADAMRHARDAQPADPVQRISDMGKSYVEFAIANPETFKLMFGSTPHLKNDEATRETGHRCFDVLIAEVSDYMGADTGSEESRILSVMLWSFVHGVASLTIDKDYEAARVPVYRTMLIEEATKRLLPKR